MKSKEFLVTIYYTEPDTHDNFILDTNTDDDYEYDKCITKVLHNHLTSVNSPDIHLVDIAVDTDINRIKQIAKELI